MGTNPEEMIVQYLSKNFAVLFLLSILTMVSACGSGSSKSSPPQHSEQELISDTQSLNAEEVSLANIGLKFKVSYEYENGLSTEKFSWDKESLGKLKASEGIQALHHYISKAEDYLAKYDRFQTKDGIYTLSKKDEIQAKVKLAKDTIVTLQPFANQDAAESAKTAPQSQASPEPQASPDIQPAQQPAIKSYTLAELDSDSKDLENTEKILQSKGILLKRSGVAPLVEITWDEAHLRSYLKEKASKSDRKSTKESVLADIRGFQEKLKNYLAKYEFPFYLTANFKTIKIDYAFAVQTGLEDAFADTYQMSRALEEMAVHVDKMKL